MNLVGASGAGAHLHHQELDQRRARGREDQDEGESVEARVGSRARLALRGALKQPILPTTGHSRARAKANVRKQSIHRLGWRVSYFWNIFSFSLWVAKFWQPA